ncbi:MAG: hypothetical protein ACJATI_005286 [Halioglobus sp.]
MQLRYSRFRLKGTNINHQKIKTYEKSNFSTFTLLVFSLFSVSAFGDTLNINPTKELKTKIEQYVKTINKSELSSKATVYNHFLVKEEGFIYTIDFMITSNGEITILTKDIEEEYYKVDLFNAKYVEKYSIVIPTIKV